MKFQDTEKVNSLFKLWDKIGPSWEHSLYVNDKFDTMEDFYLSVAKYYGIKGGVEGLKQHIINDINGILSNPENIPCDGVNIRLVDVNIENTMDSKQHMLGRYMGYGSKPSTFYEYEIYDLDSFVCPEYNDNNWSPKTEIMYRYNIENEEDLTPEIMKEIKLLCVEDSCVREATDMGWKILAKKYGIRTNTNVADVFNN